MARLDLHPYPETYQESAGWVLIVSDAQQAIRLRKFAFFDEAKLAFDDAAAGVPLEIVAVRDYGSLAA